MHYSQGKLLTDVETISRASLKNNTPKIEDTEIKCSVHTNESNHLVSDNRLQQFQNKKPKSLFKHC